MQKHTVPSTNLILPVLLPLCKGVLLKHLMRSDNEHWRSSLKTYTTLNADNSVADVHISANTIL